VQETAAHLALGSSEVSGTTRSNNQGGGWISSNDYLETQITDLKTIERETKEETYTVKQGDSLSSISQQLLGDRYRYSEIVEANKDKYPSLETNQVA
jgi:nucleoid-associated protein YgaU